MTMTVQTHSTERQRHRRKVHRCLDTMEQMLADGSFPPQQQRIGLELEFNLVDAAMQPSMTNGEVLGSLDDPSFTYELGRHNIELNVPPRGLAGTSLADLDDELRNYLTDGNAAASCTGAGLAQIGILPTIMPEHFETKWMTSEPRYLQLNDTIFATRGENLLLSMDGPPLPGRQRERLRMHCDTILPEAACTSAQLHLQVTPAEFGRYWNAAQCLAGVQVAIGANSPFLAGRALWHETRIPLFLQSTDTRTEELRNQGVRPRVWFGEQWISSIVDLFDENIRYFPALLTELDDEDPEETLATGCAPRLSELRLHNGCVWRWNRPVYDVVDGQPHLRIENRVLPAGPTMIDVVANAAFYYGAQRALAEAQRPLWHSLSFQAAEDNLYLAARNGLDTHLYWPGSGWIPPDELVLRVLLPMAAEGLASAGVHGAVIDRYLGVIAQRCITRQTGAAWQRATVDRFEAGGADRETALRRMLTEYVALMHSGEPVHGWPVP